MTQYSKLIGCRDDRLPDFRQVTEPPNGCDEAWMVVSKRGWAGLARATRDGDFMLPVIVKRRDGFFILLSVAKLFDPTAFYVGRSWFGRQAYIALTNERVNAIVHANAGPCRDVFFRPGKSAASAHDALDIGAWLMNLLYKTKQDWRGIIKQWDGWLNPRP